jgi:hypothetical protein
MAIIGEIRVKELEKRIEDYWNEHAEERMQLIGEKLDLEDKIEEIKKEAGRVNDNGECKEIEKELNALRIKKSDCGKKEIAEIKGRIDQLRREYYEIGFFKFKDKKEIKEKIEVVEQELKEKESEIRKEQDKIEVQIQDKQRKITSIQKRVQDEKDKILKKCQPHQSRIKAIDFELTRAR